MRFQAWNKQLNRSLELDAVICDPPYDKAGVDAKVFRDLALFAGRHLKRGAGAPLVVMVGEKYFSEILEQLLSSGKFRYRWSLKVVYSKETKVRKPALVNSRVKLVLVLQRINEMEGLPYLHRDLLDAGPKTKVLSNENEDEDWQQDPETFEQIIRLVCKPGASIADPTMGWGTTGVAAVRGGMKFFACEMIRDRFKKACGEIALELKRHGIT